MDIYFDNAASTKALEEAVERAADISLHCYANPASLSNKALEAERIIVGARKSIAGILGAKEEEIYFTSGGTESNNWAIFGAALGYCRSGKHIITTKVEHPAVEEPFSILKGHGFSVTELSPDKKGYISVESLREAVREDTILVSILHTSNETGTIQPIAALGRAIKEKNPKTLFHVDAVQAFGKEKIQVQQGRIDLLSASGHKFHAPRGVGFLYRREGLKVTPYLYGGGHQRGMRSGTENTAGAAALQIAAEAAYQDIEGHAAHVRRIKGTLYQGIKEIPDCMIHGETDFALASPYVLHISFLGVKSEVLLHALEERGVIVAAGSACNSQKAHRSALQPLGVAKEELESAVRFSFSRFNTEEEAVQCIEYLKEIVPALRRVQRRR